MAEPTVCEGTCTVTHVVTMEQLELTDGKVTDLMELWSLFLALAVVVVCCKAIYSRFRIDTNQP